MAELGLGPKESDSGTSFLLQHLAGSATTSEK